MRAICNLCWYISICLVVITLFGCEKAQQRFAISGQVTLDGKPVSKAVIAFEPIGAFQGTGAICVINEGAFELKAEVGIHAGKYSVRISDEKPDLEEFEQARFSGGVPIPAPTIPLAYSQQDAFEVTIDGPRSDLLFAMHSKRSKSK